MSKYGEQNEAMKFYDSNRPTSSVEKNLKTRDTEYSKVDFPQHKDETYSNYEEFLASEEYRNAVEKVKTYTGIGDANFSDNFYELSSSALKIMRDVMVSESKNKDALEKLAEKILRDYFQLPEDKVRFELKLNREPIKVEQKPSKSELEDKEKKLVKDFINLDEERIQRRLQNAMSHGLSVDKQWIYEKAENELIALTGDQNIIQKYGIFTSVLLYNYWRLDNSGFGVNESKETLNETTALGKSRFTTEVNPPIVFAEGVSFPFLIHEGLKGTMSFLGDKRKPKHKPTYLEARRLEDTLRAELWDIRLGPAIWRKFYSKLPLSLRNEEEKRKFVFYLVANVANLPAKEFLVLYKEIFSDSKSGKELLAALYYDLVSIKSGDIVSKKESTFKNLIKQIADESPNIDWGDLLSGTGATLPT